MIENKKTKKIPKFTIFDLQSHIQCDRMCGEPSNFPERKRRNKTKTTNMQSSLPSPHHSKKSTILGLVFWLFAVLIFFYPAVFNNKIIAPIDCLECVFRPFADKPIENVHNHFVVDSISQYLPYKWSMKTGFEEDGYIGWNPYTFNGNPIHDNTMTSPGDLNNLLYAVFPFWLAWDIGVILQFFIAGCGIILLLRYYKIPIWAALLGAVSFAFYSQFILWMYHKWVGAMIWSPYLVWALLKYKQRLVNVPAIIFMTLCWRTGHLQSCTFAFILVACVWGAEVWKKDNVWPSRKTVSHLTLSFLLTGVLGALLSLDIFVDTLQRMEGCKDMGFMWGFNNSLTLGTLLFPTIMGIPETLDLIKIIKLDLFDIKFGGSLVFILAVIGCFNPRAPRVAKVLFIASLLLACTPLITYIYSRSTVVMALGMAWLATWQIYDFTQVEFKNIYWKKIALVIVGMMGIWLLGSIVISCFKTSIQEELSNVITPSASSIRLGREEWMQLRIDRFLSQILIWDWKNLLLCLCLLAGILCSSRIKPNRNNTPWIIVVVMLTYGELLVFSSTWISYSEKPVSPYLYNSPSWMEELKSHIEDGSVAIRNTPNDRDFLCYNHLSTYNIRLADGYETFRPKYLKPLNKNKYDIQDYAQAGISHVLCNTQWNEWDLPGWKRVMTGQGFELYENPAYRGRYLLNNTSALAPSWKTASRIHFTIPPHTTNLHLLESYHPGWTAYLSGQEVSILETERGGMKINLPDTQTAQPLLLEFHMPYQWWYHSIMILTLLGLIIVSIKQKCIAQNDNK